MYSLDHIEVLSADQLVFNLTMQYRHPRTMREERNGRHQLELAAAINHLGTCHSLGGVTGKMTCPCGAWQAVSANKEK